MIMNNVALDTNILTYLWDKDGSKKKIIADSLVLTNPVISTQVVSEYLNVCRKLLQLPKVETFELCNNVFERCRIVPVSITTLSVAFSLVRQYDFQIFDAIIVSSALESGCEILYSEDMHNGLKVDKLTIINPFL